MKCVRLCADMLCLRYVSEMLGNIIYFYPVKIKYLAARQDSRKYLVFFSCGKNKDRVLRRLFQCFQKSVECRGREHMHLVNNIYFVFSKLRCKTYLVNKV